MVDEDVNIHDFEDVWWAVITPCRVDQHLLVIPGAPGLHRDRAGVFRGRLGIDATKPHGREQEFERKRIRGLDGINLRDFLPR